MVESITVHLSQEIVIFLYYIRSIKNGTAKKIA
jgi:hypothetical protein